MAVAKEKNFIKSSVYLVQDNIFLRQMVSQMVRFISDTGILSFSTDRRTQDYMIRNYFRSLSLDAIEQKGYKMGIGTPWGDEVTDLIQEFEEESDIEDEQENESENN